MTTIDWMTRCQAASPWRFCSHARIPWTELPRDCVLKEKRTAFDLTWTQDWAWLPAGLEMEHWKVNKDALSSSDLWAICTLLTVTLERAFELSFPWIQLCISVEHNWSSWTWYLFRICTFYSGRSLPPLIFGGLFGMYTRCKAHTLYNIKSRNTEYNLHSHPHSLFWWIHSRQCKC
jgi:hypothetical protein